MYIKRAIIMLMIVFGIVPLAAYALTLDEINARIQELLERVSVLKAQLEQAEQNAGVSKVYPPLPCLSLGRTLRLGMRGEDAQKLQEFLIKAGLLAKGNSTGYFGPLTEAAVKKWQSAEGIVSSGSAETAGYGIVGPKTRASILEACRTGRSQAGEAARICPVEPSAPPASACVGAWEKGFDVAGCVTGYQCITASTTPESVGGEPEPPPSMSVLSPGSSVIVTGGNLLTIRWKSSNVPSQASVSLSLIDSSGNVVGDIVRNLASSGTYLWRVPQGSTGCSEGENAFDCIEKFARCDGNTSICSLEPGTYAIRATLSDLEDSSEPFQIAGTAITDLLQSLVGAPAVSSAFDTPYVGTSSKVGMCVHNGQSFDEGTTLSTPCSGNCSSGSGTGFITGTCTGGTWCIPYTAYCAASLADINLNAYEGGGGATAEEALNSVYTSGCPQEGWRAYLSCPYGGCVTGWNTCRGGVWVRDEKQSVVPVGTQGPCQSDQLWCEVGTEHGFGCVLASQCVNGKATF